MLTSCYCACSKNTKIIKAGVFSFIRVYTILFITVQYLHPSPFPRLVLSPEWAWYHLLPVVLSPLLFCFSLTFDTLLSIHIKPTHCLPLAPPPSPVSSKNMKILCTSPKSV